MINGYACQNCLYQTNTSLPQCPQCGLRNIFIGKSALPVFNGQAPMPPLLRCIDCDFLSIRRHKECPGCTRKYAVGQIHYKLVSKGRYRLYHIFFGLLWMTVGIFVSVLPFAMKLLNQQKILITERISDFQSIGFIGFGLVFIIMGISSWYRVIFKSHF
jgi:RNA polymerase subunit RPABC4/transcription elongation factor Spt4